MLFRISFLLQTLCALSYGALTPEAIAILETFPDKALSPETVVHQAIKVSDSFKALRAQALIAEAADLQRGALFEPKAFARFGFLNDRTEPTTPFGTTLIAGHNYTLGLNSQFATGTQLGLEVSHGINELRLPTFGQNYAETRATLNLTQNLWQDSFGTALRANRDSLHYQAESGRAAFREVQEQWFMDILEVYYYAWLAQTQQRSAAQGLARRERLLNIVERKMNRGTSEQPDLLQVESARATSEVRLSLAIQQLGDRWRALITILKLPESFYAIDPIEIPMRLDDPYPAAASACGPRNQPSPSPATSSTTERTKLASDAARLSAERASSENRPDLKLQVGVGANSVAPNSTSTWGEFFRTEHPMIKAGLQLTVPLGFSAEEARVRAATADQIRAEGAHAQSADLLKTDWINGCLDLHRLKTSQDLLEKAYKSQVDRERMEQERFNVGRSNTLQVIQAGDDMTDTNLLLRTTEIQLRLAAWKVLRMTGKAYEQVKRHSAN